ncbi:TA system antitoxin ParD family protein [Arthrobacter sp.]|uniref:TA system antitoxin ParD family protein n=1 Tax=Arthrobacter sp. TaxID=1667 RepID=UPI003A8D6B50
MSRTSQPTRLPADVYDSAAAAVAVTSRTVPQQIAHWARIGRELEMDPQLNQRAIARVLAGTGNYDSIDEQEQAIVREEWGNRAMALREGLDYAAGFDAAGESYSELDEDGNVVVRQARA